MLHVGVRRVRPAPILSHRRAHQGIPVGLLAGVHAHRAIQGVLDVVVLAAVEREAVGSQALLRGAFPVVVHVEHGVPQTAGPANDGDASVAHGDHLR